MNKFLLASLLVLTTGAGCSSTITSDTAVRPTAPTATSPAPTIAVGEPNPATPTEPMTETRTFARADLGLSFAYPAKFGDVDFEMGPSPEVGKMFRGKFTKTNIQFGGVTPDFELGRELTVLDYGFRGRKLEDWVAPNELAKKIIVKGGTVQLLTGKSTGRDEMDYFQPGMIGAVVYLKDKEFPGAGFLVTLDDTVTAAEFEQMVSTIEVK